MTKVAIVILNWNGKTLLQQFLPSVVKHTKGDGVEIIVADNASNDDSILFLEEEYSEIRIIKLSENYGFAEGYNRALAQIEAEYFVLLNSDVEVTPNWLPPLLNYMDGNPDVVALQPKILAQRNKLSFEYAGASGGYIDKYGFPFCRGRIFDVVEEDGGQYDDIIEVFWASGACMLVRSKDYFESGGLDADFFAHMEEIDLCWRFQLRGKRIVCIPSSLVYHVGGATLGEENAHKVYLNFRNNMLMLYKNVETLALNRVIRTRKLLNWIAALKFLLCGQYDKYKAVLKAHKDFKALVPKYKQIRQNNLHKQYSTLTGVYNKSIVWDYYIKGLKKFSQLKF